MYEEHMMQGWAETGELLQKENEIKKTTIKTDWTSLLKKSLVKEKSLSNVITLYSFCCSAIIRLLTVTQW